MLLLESLECVVVAAGGGYSAVAARVCGCLASQNSRVSERAMEMWKNDKFSEIATEELKGDRDLTKALVRAVGSGLKPSWNPTVNKMRYLVLCKIRDGVGEAALKTVADECYGGASPRVRPGGKERKQGEREAAALRTEKNDSDSDVESVASDEAKKERISKVSIKRGGSNAFMASVSTTTSISAQMGAGAGTGRGIGRGMAPWALSGSGGQPPVTVTGVAPWAVGAGAVDQDGGRQQPPVTITGVAPWAVQTKRPPRGPGLSMPRAKLMKGLGEAKVEELKEDDDAGVDTEDAMDEDEGFRPVSPPPTGYMLLKAYMDSIKPESKDKVRDR